jgi:hypothetical protein
LRKLLVEDNPVIEGYDQDQFAEKLHYNDRDMAPALEAFRAARATTSQLIDVMTEDDWKRSGVHTESGPYSIEKWLTIYADHAHNHAAQIQRLKKRSEYFRLKIADCRFCAWYLCFVVPC